MSKSIWRLLQIEPCTDQVQIKRAYARQSKVYHPEEDPEGFMRLREAYTLAMKWAEEAEKEIPVPEGEEAENDAPARGQEPLTPEEPSQSGKPEKEEEAGQDQERMRAEEAEKEIPVPEGEEEAENDAPERGRRPLTPEEPEVTFVLRQDFEGPNSYQDSDAHRSFLAVYKKENQKNWKVWMEYVTSPEFLAVAREEEFCALLRDTVREKEAEFKPGQEFLKSLYIAYCFTAEYYDNWEEEGGQLHFRREQNMFTVPEPIFEIARRYPAPRKMTGNDYIMKVAFSDYYHLLSMSEGIGWTDESMRSLMLVLSHYTLPCIKDKYDKNDAVEHARHPLGLRLLNFFFETAELHEECYKIAWETLGLNQAVMGRNKLLYGRLREICLEKCPGLSGQEANFSHLDREYKIFIEGKETDPEWETQELEKFFRREDVKQALHNRRYVETYVLKYWIDHLMSSAFLRRLQAFYEADMTAPCARQILQKIQEAEEDRRLYRQNSQDKEAPASGELLSVSYRPFLRYFLNTAFRDSQELSLYLQEQLPYFPEWAGRLFGLDEGRRMEPVSRRIMLDGTEIEVRMHMYYVEYRVDGREMFRPFLPYEKAALLGTEELLLLLPVTVPSGDKSRPYLHNAEVCPESKKLAGELKERLAETALPPENRSRIAEYLGTELMQRFFDAMWMEERGLSLPLVVYQETQEALYCARWQPDERRMSLYVEQGRSGMLLHSTEVYDFVEDESQAAALGKELLGRLIAPASIDCSCMEKLPGIVYVSRPLSPESALTKEEITTEALNGLLEEFSGGGLSRLEFAFEPCKWELKAEEVESYPRMRSLVFLKENNDYTCYYFDDTCYLFHGLMRKTNSIGAEDDGYISLTHRKLPPQCVFHSFDSIQCNLEQILRMASGGGITQKADSVSMLDGCAWRSAWGGVFIQNRRVKYNLAKQELGKFPLERAYNSERQPVLLDQEPNELNRHPMELEQRTTDGEIRITQIDGRKKPAFTEAVKQFFQGSVAGLRLSWDVSAEDYREHYAPSVFDGLLARRAGKPLQSHIILRRDGDRFTLLCLQDLAEQAEYCVADIGTYMDVEKKYPKDTFLGKTVPAYLVHKDPVFLRNRLDLLLEYMDCLLPVTRRFAEFASENPVKKRDYEVIRAEFAGSRENED